MFKVFEQPREIIDMIEVRRVYGNHGYILINTSEGQNGVISGELLATCDHNITDIEKFNNLVADTIHEGTSDILVGNTFDEDEDI